MSAFNEVTVGSVKYSLGQSWGGDFDAVLSRKEVSTHAGTGVFNYKLTIKLRIQLVQLNPVFPVGAQRDADDKAFIVKPWKATEWATFVQGAQSQAQMWNSKFWLKPPAAVSDYDQTDFNGSVRRPYVKCVLEIDFNPKASAAHKKIPVANLEANFIAGAKNSTTFRSHALLYDSFDTVPVIIGVQDQSNAVNQMQHYTIAHEIGHALGLGHIGETLQTPLCKMAVNLDTARLPVGGAFAGGSNSSYCYGWGQAKHIAENVMGFGATFNEFNAGPWQWGLRSLRKAPMWEYWTVHLTDPGEWFVPPPK